MISTPYVSSSSLRSEEGDAAPAETASQAAERVIKKHIGSRDKKIHALSTERPTRPNLQQAYQAAYRKHFDGDPNAAITGKEWGNYKRFVQITEFPEGFDYCQFFEETIQYWPNLMTGDFKWVKGSPARPTLAYICKLIKHLYEHYLHLSQGSEKYSLAMRYVEDGVTRDKFEDVCKNNSKLSQQVSQLQEQIPSAGYTAQANMAVREREEMLRQQDTMNRRIKALQMENARLRSKQDDGEGQEEDLPDFSEVTLAKTSTATVSRRRKRTVPLASRD